MKLRLSIILLAAALAAAPAAGQTIKSLGYNTTNGQVVYSGTNTLTFTNPLNLTNTVRVGVFGQGGASGFAGRTSGGNLALYGTNVTTAQPSFYGFDGFNNTAFSAGVARTNLGLGTTNDVQFNKALSQSSVIGGGVDAFLHIVTLGQGEIQIGWGSGDVEMDELALTLEQADWKFYKPFSVPNATNRAIIRTNLELGAANNVTFSNITASGTLGVSDAATFSTNVTVNGNLSVGSFTTTTPSTWALDATETAAATNGVLDLPSNANVIRLTNSTAISGVSGGVLCAFYYLVNQTTNAVTISNVGGITVQGGTPLTLGANQAATLVATGATNASVAARGDLNDVALGGTANTAPSQTASSGSSLMTRDLVDNNPLWSLGSVRVLASYATNNSGTASSTSVIGFGSSQLVSGTATNGYARSSLLSALNMNPATGFGINLSQSISVGMTFGTINTSAENAIRLVVGGNGGVPAPADSNALTGRGFGVEITRTGVTAGEANLRLFSHDGTNYTTSSFSTNFTMTSARQMQLLITKGTNRVIELFFSHAAASKAPSRPSTTPLLTLSNGPSGTAAGAFIDLVTVNNSTSAPVNANTLYFYNGMVEVKD